MTGPEMPSDLAERIRARIYRDTRPVKPLMPSFVYASLMLLLVACIGVIYAAVLNFKGLHALSTEEAVALLVWLALCALLGSIGLARSMRPAAGSLYTWLLSLLSLGVYEALILVLFRDYSTSAFVSRGIVCLGLGVLDGILVAVPLWVIVRRGFVVQPVLAGATIGLVAGLSGLTALTLHCTVLTVPHTGIWHAAVVVVCVAAGAVVFPKIKL